MNLEINPANVKPSLLQRNLRAVTVHSHQQMQDFVLFSEKMDKEQQHWVEFSHKLNDRFLKAKQENHSLRA